MGNIVLVTGGASFIGSNYIFYSLRNNPDDKIAYSCAAHKNNHEMISSEKYGVFHATNFGFCSWFDFAYEIFRVAGMDVSATPIVSSEYPTAAVRPKNSRFSSKSLLDAVFSVFIVRCYLQGGIY